MGPALGEGVVMRVLFARVVGLTPEQRAEFLSDPTLDPDTREELIALLEADKGSETFLDGTIQAERAQVAGLGERFGAFETTAILGRGGMGLVFKAERMDGELSQTVALKVVRHAWFDPFAIQRFRNERQVLSALVHNNIARLLDGGTRDDGLPYLVMEYVDGIAVDRYCDAHGLAVDERLRLFLPLCDAVEYAHSKLIIHRDLKPSNVLVTASGEPKLLDFGIAKALDAGTSVDSQTFALTPEFASPEQIRGETATTATDVYGLGGILYFLLTGKKVHRVAGTSAAELQQAICDTPPEPATGLKSDLQNILLKALHYETDRRYRSARELREDLERYLGHRPVLATRDSWAYRTKQFLRRHTIGSIAAALALLAVVAGIAESLYQAHRAQQRFAQVRTLSNSFVFDFEAAIRDTPGTLAARHMVASTARQYLADLSTDAESDPALKRELAESYFRLAGVESAAREYDLWLEDLQKSAAIIKNLGDDYHGAPAQRLLYVKVMGEMVRYWVDRSPKESIPIGNEASKVATYFYLQSPQDPAAARALILAALWTGVAQCNNSQLKESRQSLESALRLADDLLRRFADDNDLAFQRASIGNRLSAVLAMLGDVETGHANLEKSIALFDPLISQHPDNIRWTELRIRMGVSRAGLLRRAAKDNPPLTPQVLPAFRDVYSLAKAAAKKNPGDDDFLDDQFVMTERYGNQLAIAGKPEEALARFREAEAVLTLLSEHEPQDHRTLSLRANNWDIQGVNLATLKRWREASTVLDKAWDLSQQILAKWPDDSGVLDDQVTLLTTQSHVDRELGRIEIARQRCRLAFQSAQRLLILQKEEESPISAINELRKEALILGVPDPLPARLHAR